MCILESAAPYIYVNTQERDHTNVESSSKCVAGCGATKKDILFTDTPFLSHFFLSKY